MSWADLAKAADLSRDTIARFLRGEELKPATIEAMRAALEKAGAEFIGDDGVRIVKRRGKR